MEWNGMNGIASGSVAEWNRERQRGGMEFRENTKNIIFSYIIKSKYGEFGFYSYWS